MLTGCELFAGSLTLLRFATGWAYSCIHQYQPFNGPLKETEWNGSISASFDLFIFPHMQLSVSLNKDTSLSPPSSKLPSRWSWPITQSDQQPPHISHYPHNSSQDQCFSAMFLYLWQMVKQILLLLSTFSINAQIISFLTCWWWPPPLKAIADTFVVW